MASEETNRKTSTHIKMQLIRLKVRNQFTEFQNVWGTWADETFPKSTRDSIASHFREEAREFAGGLEERHIEHGFQYVMHSASHDPVEAADCLLLLLHDAHKAGYNLLEVALKKATVNVGRTWDTTDDGGHGHFKHKQAPKCKETGEHVAEDPDASIRKCKYCGLESPNYHECRYGECRVRVYDPDQDYCERHEAQDGFL